MTSEKLGVGKFYKLFPLIFTFRHVNSARSALVDAKISDQEREQIVNDFKDSTVEDFNQFLQNLPRDMLLIFRTNALVRSLNLSLGGNTSTRLSVMFEFALRGSHVQHFDSVKAKSRYSWIEKLKLWYELMSLKFSMWILSTIFEKVKRPEHIKVNQVG